ncbi:MAG: hypothetical protein MZV65_52890 [Chromatiales bacterium]|nr:hypothetical protein [Chromatiales bacterium]
MMKKVKADKEAFEKSLHALPGPRAAIFSQQTNVLYTHLNLKNLDAPDRRDQEGHGDQPDHGRAHDLHGQFLQARAGDHGPTAAKNRRPGDQGA